MIPFILSLSGFLLLKITNFGVRLSDANIYWYIAYLLSQGKILYKEIPFLNFPLFAYISFFYYELTRGRIELFFLIPTFEVIITSILIFRIIYNQTKNQLTSFVAAILYPFSFIVLTTSDHQTGVFAASLFAVLAFFFWQKERFFLTGVLLGLSFFTKAYFLPVILAFFIAILFSKILFKKKFFFLLGLFLTAIISFGPFLIQSFDQIIDSIFKFSLTRPQGVLKTNIIWFFISHDLILFLLLIFNLLNIRKNLFFGILSIFGILFFLLYKDVYYLYLNFLVPFLCLSLPGFLFFIKKRISIQAFVIPTIIFILLIYNLIFYLMDFRNLQKVEQINIIVENILKEKPAFLYGVNDITPALLYLTKIPPLENVFDAYPIAFTKKILDKEFLTQKVISQKTIIITHGVYYPQVGIQEKILDDGILNIKTVEKSCRFLSSFPVETEGAANQINLFKCY